MKRRSILIVPVIISLFLAACSPAVVSQPNPYALTPFDGLKIASCHPSDLTAIFGTPEEFPQFQPGTTWFPIDLRSQNFGGFDLTDELEGLLHADFDDRTKWPEILPQEFNYDEILALGRNPGLNLRELHNAGITGKGVGIAVIDQTLLVDHIEYKENLKHYELINTDADIASMHGGAVSSIAAGKSVGVAPGADLYHIALNFGEFIDGQFIPDFNWTAAAIDRIIEINSTLPSDEKIRVIAIARGWDPGEKGFSEVMAAINRAGTNNIFVISSSLERSHGLDFHGLGRDVYSDPDKVESYGPHHWWRDSMWRINSQNKQLLVPMDSRATASPTGHDEYVFYRGGGVSWAIPWLAGLYALACQVDPEITPGRFWELALQTGSTIEVEYDEEIRDFGKIANPIALVDLLKGEK